MMLEIIRDGKPSPINAKNSEPRTSELGRRCRAIYEATLREHLEKTNMDDFVSIEPDSGDYFVGKTLTEVAKLAEAAYPTTTAVSRFEWATTRLCTSELAR